MRYVLIFIVFILLVAGLFFLAFNYLGLGKAGDTNTPTPPAVTPPTITPPGGTTPGTTPPTAPGSNNGNTNGKTNSQRLTEAISKSSGNYRTGQILELEIKATPPNKTSNKTKLRLEAIGLEIIGYKAPASGWGAISTGNECSTQFSSGDVCVDLIKEASQTIAYGESLGKVKVRFNTRGQGILRFSANNGYFTGDVFSSFAGKIATFGVTGRSLPSTGLISNQALLIIIGVTIAILAFVLLKTGKLQPLFIQLIGLTGLGLNTFDANQTGIKAFINRLGFRRISSIHRSKIGKD